MGSAFQDSSLLDEAKRLVKEGDLLQAYDLLTVKQSLEIVRLRNAIADHLRTELSVRLLRRTYFPQRLAILGDIRGYRLTADDVYVLGLFDGITSIADAVDISPLNQLATLRSTAKLIDLGLLTGMPTVE